MPQLSRYHTLHVAMREMRIWPQDATKCCKNAGKFFHDEEETSHYTSTTYTKRSCPLRSKLVLNLK